MFCFVARTHAHSCEAFFPFFSMFRLVIVPHCRTAHTHVIAFFFYFFFSFIFLSAFCLLFSFFSSSLCSPFFPLYIFLFFPLLLIFFFSHRPCLGQEVRATASSRIRHRFAGTWCWPCGCPLSCTLHLQLRHGLGFPPRTQPETLTSFKIFVS